MKDYKIPVYSEEHSEYIQRWLFLQGYRWAGDTDCNVSHTHSNFLYVVDGSIRYSSSFSAYVTDDSEVLHVPFPDKELYCKEKAKVIDNKLLRLKYLIDATRQIEDEYRDVKKDLDYLLNSQYD